MQTLAGGGEVRVIAGAAEISGRTINGPIQGISAEVVFLDVRLPAGGYFEQALVTDHNAFVYPYEGKVMIGALEHQRLLTSQSAGVLSSGDRIEIRAEDQGAAFLLLAGRPLKEPIVQYGPFVMNTREEIEQAIADYKNGQLVSR